MIFTLRYDESLVFPILITNLNIVLKCVANNLKMKVEEMLIMCEIILGFHS